MLISLWVSSIYIYILLLLLLLHYHYYYYYYYYYTTTTTTTTTTIASLQHELVESSSRLVRADEAIYPLESAGRGQTPGTNCSWLRRPSRAGCCPQAWNLEAFPGLQF